MGGGSVLCVSGRTNSTSSRSKEMRIRAAFPLFFLMIKILNHINDLSGPCTRVPAQGKLLEAPGPAVNAKHTDVVNMDRLRILAGDHFLDLFPACFIQPFAGAACNDTVQLRMMQMEQTSDIIDGIVLRGIDPYIIPMTAQSVKQGRSKIIGCMST